MFTRIRASSASLLPGLLLAATLGCGTGDDVLPLEPYVPEPIDETFVEPPTEGLVFEEAGGVAIYDDPEAEKPAIIELQMIGVELSDKLVNEIAKQDSLRALDLSETNADDNTLRALSGLANLESLVLASTSVSGSGVSALSGMRALSTLDLSSTPVDDYVATAVSGMPSIKLLTLTGTNITDATLATLAASLPELTALSVEETGVTPAGVMAFLKARPMVRLAHSVDLTEIAAEGDAPAPAPPAEPEEEASEQ